MYGQPEETWGTDVVSGLAAMATGYLMGSWAKATKNPLYPLIGNGVLGVGGLGAKHLLHNELLHETSEAVGYVGLGNVGLWASEATTTWAGKGPGAAPVFLPKAGGAARARAEAAARVLVAQAAAAAAAGRQPQPEFQPTTGNAHDFQFESVA